MNVASKLMRSSLTRLPARSAPFACLAALTTLVRPSAAFLPAAKGQVPTTSSSLLPSVHARPIACTTRVWLRMAAMGDSSAKDGLFLFDFDGVVCDSCDECTVSAWRTCKMLDAIPKEEDSSGDAPPRWLFDKMREIRPAIEVGWQIPVLLSVFLEQKAGATADSRAMTVPEIIQQYERLVEDWLAAHNLTESDMIQAFGQVRDEWIASDLSSWLDINTFYEGISRGITDCPGESVLVTTKQQRFATALVRHAGIAEGAMTDDSIYGLGMYKSKADVIVDRMQKGGYEARNTHFFEDRWPTLAKCLKDDRLEGVQLYLCAWGYVTKEELALAESDSRVEVLTLDDFARVVTQK